MTEFANRWPDVRLLAITRLNGALPTGHAKVSAERDESLGEQVVVSVVPAQMVTPVSRLFMVTVECWAADKVTAFTLCGDAAYALESSPRRGGIVTTELNSGPNEHRDEAGIYYYDATVNWTVSRILDNN